MTNDGILPAGMLSCAAGSARAGADPAAAAIAGPKAADLSGRRAAGKAAGIGLAHASRPRGPARAAFPRRDPGADAQGARPAVPDLGW